MQTLFEPNEIACPNCSHTFVNTRINGLALIEAINIIDARKRMYCKLALDLLENYSRSGNLNFPMTKKIVLDHFNDWGRDIQTILGSGQEVE